MTTIKCSLCPICFDDTDPYILIRKDRHEQFHANARRDKRNTTNGIVTWEVLNC